MVYLDYAATTPVDPRVVEAMLPYLSGPLHFGNAGSAHYWGQQAAQAVDKARQQVADLIGAVPQEIIWTSGATEANNLALKGTAALYSHQRKHIITLKTEHPSVLGCCEFLEKQGFGVTYLAPEKSGLLDLNKFEAALREDTLLVSIMHVNNEIGTIQDISAIAKITSARGIFFHVDAAQSVGKITLDVNAIPVDLISLCAHKIYGPKGIGALYVRRKPRIRVVPLFHGGGQEQDMRSGTLPVHQIVGMGTAFALAEKEMLKEAQRIKTLREQLWRGFASLDKVSINGESHTVWPGILSLCFANVTAETFMQALPELAFSTGAACHAKKIKTSHVLRGIGLSEENARHSIRISFGRFTTPEEIDLALKIFLSFIKI